AEDDAAATRGVISAFGWAPRKNLQGVVKQLLATRSAFGRQVGIGACAVHRVNPGPPLVQALSSHHAGEKARAAKAAGELGLADLREPLEQSLGDEDPEVRFWSTWSACLLGSAAARPGLEGFANTEGPRQRQALELLMRLLPADAGKTWLRTHFAGQENLRFALIGAGLHGDPFYLEPLIKQFSREEVARVAGEAFEMITGLNLFQRSFEILDPVEITAPVEAEDLEGLDEEALDALDEDDDNEEEALEEDIGLVRPDPAKVQPWFMEHRADFPSGERFLCGHPISLDHCEQVLRDGRQRQRRAAALEVALAKPGTALFEVRAPGLRQATALRSS
ncbi:MAG: TIGR02270 family protein, partial [Pseudomonadota bacterium]